MLTLLAVAASILLVTGLVASALRGWPIVSAPVGAAGRVAGGLLAAVAAGRILYGGKVLPVPLPPAAAPLRLELDPLCALVLLALAAVAVPTGIAAAAEARAERRPAWLGAALLLVVAGAMLALFRPGALDLLPPDIRRIAADPRRGALIPLTLAIAVLACAPGLAERRRTTASGAALASAVLAGLGAFALMRVVSMIGVAPIWLGSAVVGIGMFLALGAMSWARQEWEVRRILARTGFRGIGLVLVGAGAGLVGLTVHHAGLAFLGFATALLQALAFIAYQPLLLLSGDAVRHATGTAHLHGLGGLLRRMRDTGFGFAVGALSAAGLPPGAAFAPQLLLYAAALSVALAATTLPLRAGAIGVLAGLAIADLLAGRGFFRLYRRIFLGGATGPGAEAAREVSSPRRVPLHALAIAALVLGLAPLLGLVAVSGPTLALLEPLRSARSTSALDAALRLGRVAGLVALGTLVGAACVGAGAFLWRRRRERALAPDPAAAAPR